ncbi:MAG: CO/xanthine dehydrogenase FAD-binding subunit [Woeseiaceae bacterium]|jgi:CO/xanthine dehydrogenase FAD-binding subunit
MSLPNFDYRAPETVEKAIALRQEFGDDALLMSGGLVVMILLRERLVQPRAIINLSEIPVLRRIDLSKKFLRIGAAVSHSEIANSEQVHSVVPMLCDACGHVGSPAIRNMGTLGGSICHGDGASDPAPALLALDAEALVSGPSGERRIPLKDFFHGVFSTELEENELLTELLVPVPAKRAETRFKKYTSTSEEAFATVTVAVSILRKRSGKCAEVRIGLGSVAPIPMRALEAENLLRGKVATKELIADVASAAASEADPASDAQASGQYRRDMTVVWVRRVLEDMLL